MDGVPLARQPRRRLQLLDRRRRRVTPACRPLPLPLLLLLLRRPLLPPLQLLLMPLLLPVLLLLPLLLLLLLLLLVTCCSLRLPEAGPRLLRRPRVHVRYQVLALAPPVVLAQPHLKHLLKRSIAGQTRLLHCVRQRRRFGG